MLSKVSKCFIFFNTHYKIKANHEAWSGPLLLGHKRQDHIFPPVFHSISLLISELEKPSAHHHLKLSAD